MTELTDEEAYHKLRVLCVGIKRVSKRMDEKEKYSAFAYIGSKTERELKDIRKKLIERTVKKFRAQYMPNAKPEMDFHKLMDEQLGKMGFREAIIEQWFIDATANKEILRKMSLKHLLDLARNFVPYTRDDKNYWGPTRDWTNLAFGALLELKAYTWRTASAYVPGQVSYGFNSKNELGALAKLIDIVTLERDPSTVLASLWLSNHGQIRDPKQFYGKHLVNHPTVAAFQFFKNTKFKIWFKRPIYAKMVAIALVKKGD